MIRELTRSPRSLCIPSDNQSSLAAVDMHTARHLFDNCVSSSAKLMQGRTVILVTHHVSLCLPGTSYLVELDKGRVVKEGSIEKLRALGVLEKVMEEEDKIAMFAHEHESSSPVDSGSGEMVENGDVVYSTPGKLIDEEARAEGRVSVYTYLLYVKAAGWSSWILTFLLLVRCTLHSCVVLIQSFPS